MSERTSKHPEVMRAREAVRRFVKDGDSVFIGGFGNLYPFALAHEIIRQRRQNLVLCKHSPELIGDQLIGSGCVGKLMFSWLGNPGIGTSHSFRRAVERGIPRKVEIEEYTHAAFTGMLKAAAMGISFLPSKALLGSDIVRVNPRVKFMDSPFDGEKLCLLPALHPDVALIHAQRADKRGNVQAWGVVSDIRDGAFASRRVVASVEEIVSEDLVRRDPNRTVVPGFLVDAIVEEPWGAHPSAVQGYYDRDNELFVGYDNATRTEAGFAEFMNKWILGVRDRSQYVKLLSAADKKRLRPRRYTSAPVNYGLYR